MKTCYKCSRELENSQFHRNIRKRDGLQDYCKDCARARNAAYYRSTPERNAQRQQASLERRNRLRKLVWRYLSCHPCVDCGESRIITLEFDHVRGKKRDCISKLINRYVAEQTVLDEIAKCEVRCANCHRIITATRAGWEILNYVKD